MRASPVQTTDGAGVPQWDETFYPYGQQWNYANEANSWWQFYGGFSRYQADLDLHLTPHRFYSSNLGRWLSPDPDNAGAMPSSPQRWNMYSYAGNNPITNSDPSGLSYCQQGSGGGIDLDTCIPDREFRSVKDKKGFIHVSQDTSITVNGAGADAGFVVSA
jgi:RHS repeat-associated protein